MSPFQPGSFAAMMPASEDALIRRIQELERDMREFKASIAGSFREISNDSLKNPVGFAGNSGKLESTPPPTTWTVACTADLIVPAWATSGVILAVGSVAGTTGATGASISGSIRINGTDIGGTTARYVSASDSDTIPIFHQWTGDPATSTISVDLMWQASAAVFIGGAAYISAIGIFGR